MTDEAEVERRMMEYADELNERVATVHERRPCPKCGAPKGMRCRSMPRGYRPLDLAGQYRELKSPHKWRVTADGIMER
jgi:hypothetical protein